VNPVQVRQYCTVLLEYNIGFRKRIRYIMKTKALKPQQHDIKEEPCYQPIGEEIRGFETACNQQLPVLLKGSTGCGNPRVMGHMAWRPTT
jgi:hypothetical protein